MQKIILVVMALVALTVASPSPKAGILSAYTAPVVAPAVVTAHSSQVVSRNYNGVVAPLVAAAPIVRAAPLVAAPHYHPYVASPYIAAPVAYY